jgi:hypothetical protein
MAQEVSEADSAIFDGGASEPLTTMLQVRVDLVSAQARKALLVGAGTKGAQEAQRVRRPFGPRYRMQPTQVSKPCIVVIYEAAMKGFERGSRRIRNWPSPVHQAQQHVNGTSVSMAPFRQWHRLSVASTEELVLSVQELRNVYRADVLDRQRLGVAVFQEVTCASGIPPLDPTGISLGPQVSPEFLNQLIDPC